MYCFPLVVRAACTCVCNHDKLSPTTRRTKSFDDQTWKVHDETVNLSANISAISTTALAIRSSQVDYDLESYGSSREPRSRSSALDEVLVVAGSEDPAGDGPSSSLNRGEVRKSRSKMKNYLKRCKDVLISGVVGHAGAGSAGNSSSTTATEDQTQDVVVYRAQGDDSQPNSTSCWYLDDNLMELRPEDNREPYSSLASARLKSESEEVRKARERRTSEAADVPIATALTAVTTTSSSSVAKIGEGITREMHRQPQPSIECSSSVLEASAAAATESEEGDVVLEAGRKFNQCSRTPVVFGYVRDLGAEVYDPS
uniref:Uncharacterized protein n=1 Tax=Anopheles melas TaxID=34690 RepID=A0A182UL37_9DIPT